MTDESEKDLIAAPVAFDPNYVPVTFVSHLVGSGDANGVANLTFAVAQFTPMTNGTVEPDPIVAARLRMDMACLAQLRKACDEILQRNLKPSNGTTH